jgi:hypothetical protein
MAFRGSRYEALDLLPGTPGVAITLVGEGTRVGDRDRNEGTRGRKDDGAPVSVDEGEIT